MLDVATVLVTMFTYIDDFCKSERRLKRGPKPAMTDSEVITLSLFCELAGKPSHYDHIRYAEQWLASYFPRLIDRSRYERRLKALTGYINEVRTRLLRDVAVAPSDIHVLDSTPVPVITFRRAHRTPLFPEAAYGRCAARGMTYYGFKLHLVVDSQGIPIHFDLTPAHVADVTMTEEILADKSRGHTVLADKGYLSETLRRRLFDEYGIEFCTSRRGNQKEQLPHGEERLLNSWRQIVEVINGMLKEQFHLERTFAKTLAGLAVKVMNKLTALTFGIFLNRLFGKNPLAIASLVA